MEDTVATILSAVAELLLEFLSELFIEAVVALITRSVRSLFANRRAISPSLAAALYFSLGFAVGGASLFLVPHPIFHRSKFNGISLLVSPILTGMAMALTGSTLRRKGWEPVRIESFGYGFAFALGMAIVRLVFAS
jgi:hypothetical protein